MSAPTLGNDEAAHGRHVVDSPDAETPGAWVHEALDRLSPADQEVLRLAAWEELDAGQIAVVLGCGRRAATMRLHRARRRLRAEIDRLRPTPPAAATPPGQRTRPEAPEGVPLPESPACPGAADGASPEVSGGGPPSASPSRTGDDTAAGEHAPGRRSSFSASAVPVGVPLRKDPRHA
jgi:RNA polymerase sigma-70 factor (ECF subfamily)